MKTTRIHQHHFPITEVVVSIAILALVAMVLFPIFSR